MKLSDYQSPIHESSCFKGIPIMYRYHPKIRKILKSRLFSIKYRGKSKPGYERPQNHCHKSGADSFAIYPYSAYPESTALKMSLWAGPYGDYKSFIQNLKYEMEQQLIKLL